MVEILDCGHPESPHGEHTRGYGIDSAMMRHCLDCCHADELRMIADSKPGGKFIGYHGNGIVSNWHGRRLMTILSARRRPWPIPGGRLVRCYGQDFRGEIMVWIIARDSLGRVWSGISPGPQMYCRLTLRKGDGR